MEAQKRILSIDVFRGLTIAFMIIVNTPGTWEHVFAPLRHAKWNGVTPTDLVFPFFLTTVGLSMAISFSKLNHWDTNALVKKVLKRTFLIFLVGFLLNWFPFYHKHLSDVRVLGVLQRIALSFGFAGLSNLLIKNKKMLFGWTVFLLLFYWFLLGYLGDYTLEGNFNRIFDSYFLSDAQVYGGFGIPFDPEGLLGTISGGAQVLLGYFLGQLLLKGPSDTFLKKSVIGGLIAIGIALVLDRFFPINKPLWTSSYVLFTTGAASIFLALLYYILDIRKQTKWAFPFKVFGRNPLISYVLSGIFVKILLYVWKTDQGNGYSILYQSLASVFGDNSSTSLLFAILYTGFIYLFALVLYRKDIIIKL